MTQPDLTSVLRRRGVSLVVGAHDALSARIAGAARPDALWVSSLGVTSVLGLVDDGTITMTEMIRAAGQVKRATDKPVMVDCDTGFGAGVNVARLVREAVAHKLDGICIEDQKSPKRNTFMNSPHRLADAKEFAKLIDTASSARAGEVLTLVARTEALAQGQPVSEAVRRARRYVKAGADAIIVQTIGTDLGLISEFLAEMDDEIPIGLITTSIEGADLDSFEDIGVRFAIYANQALRASVWSMHATYKLVRDGNGRLPLPVEMASMAEIVDIHRQGSSDGGWEES